MMALTVWGRIRFGCKISELILASICMALFTRTAVPTDVAGHPDIVIIPITFGGYIIISVGLVMGFASGDKVPKKIDLLYTWIGVALFLAAGGVTIEIPTMIRYIHEDRIPSVVACGVLSIVTAVVFIADIAFSYKDVYEYVPH